jgi:hypothetical protein
MDDEQRLHNRDERQVPDPTSTGATQASVGDGSPSDEDFIDNYEESMDDLASRLLSSSGC